MSTVMAAAAAAAAIILDVPDMGSKDTSSHADSPMLRKSDLPSKTINTVTHYCSNNTTNNSSNANSSSNNPNTNNSSSGNMNNNTSSSSCHHSSSSSCSSFSTGTVNTTALKKDRDSGHFTFIVSNSTAKKIDVDNVKKSFLRTQSFGVSLPEESPSFSAFKRGKEWQIVIFYIFVCVIVLLFYTVLSYRL